MLIQCVPNFSEGRRADVIEAIVKAAGSVADARLADWSSDPDHNRMVVTLVGEPSAVVAAVIAAARVAVDAIDLGVHKGVHPRLGAVDVVPIVPLRDITMDRCAQIARDLAHEMSDRYGIPIYLYEYASEDHRPLPDIRKRAFVSLWPDFGSRSPHPTAGATVVGARNPLIAYNIVLDVADPAAARTIARELRDGGVARFKGVRAMGLRLPSRHMTQVSMNIIDPEAAPIGSVFTYVHNRARELRVNVLESELIGAMSGATAFRQVADSLRAPSLKPGQILLETWPGSP